MGLTWRGHRKKRGYYGRGKGGRNSGPPRKDYSMHDDRFESGSYDERLNATEDKLKAVNFFSFPVVSVVRIKLCYRKQ